MIIGTREVTVTIKDSQWDEFIQDQYGVDDYSFVADQECGNDSEHRFDMTIGVDDEIDEYDAERLEEFKDGKFPSYITSTLFEDLVRREVLEPAIYYVSVCW